MSNEQSTISGPDSGTDAKPRVRARLRRRLSPLGDQLVHAAPLFSATVTWLQGINGLLTGTHIAPTWVLWTLFGTACLSGTLLAGVTIRSLLSGQPGRARRVRIAVRVVSLIISVAGTVVAHTVGGPEAMPATVGLLAVAGLTLLVSEKLGFSETDERDDIRN